MEKKETIKNSMATEGLGGEPSLQLHCLNVKGDVGW